MSERALDRPQWEVYWTRGITEEEVLELGLELSLVMEGACPMCSGRLRIVSDGPKGEELDLGKCSTCESLWHCGQGESGLPEIVGIWGKGSEPVGVMWHDISPIARQILEMQAQPGT